MEKNIRNTLYNYIKKGVLTSEKINTLTDEAIKLWYKKWWNSEYSPSGRFPISSKIEQRFESNPIKSIETLLKKQSENGTIESITAKLPTGSFKINLSQNALNKYSNAYLKKIGGIKRIEPPFKKDTGEFRKKSLKYKYNASDFKPVKVNVKEKGKKKVDDKSPLEEQDKLKKIKSIEEKTTKELLQDVVKTNILGPTSITTPTVPSTNALQLNTIYNEVFSQKMFGKKSVTLDNIKLDNEIIPIDYIPEKIKNMAKKVPTNNIVSLRSYKSDIQKLIDIVKILDKTDTTKRVLKELNQQLTDVDTKIDKLNAAYTKDADEEEVDKLVTDYTEKTTVDPSSPKKSIYSPLQIAELYEAMNKIPKPNKQLMSKLIDLLQYTNGVKLTEQESLNKLQTGIDEFNKKYKRKFDKKMEDDIRARLTTTVPVAAPVTSPVIPPKKIKQRIQNYINKLDTDWNDVGERTILLNEINKLNRTLSLTDTAQSNDFNNQINKIIVKNQKANKIISTRNIAITPEQVKQTAKELLADENFINNLQETKGLVIANTNEAENMISDIVTKSNKDELENVSRNRLDSLVKNLVDALPDNYTQDDINNLLTSIQETHDDLSNDEILKVINSYLATKVSLQQEELSPINQIDDVTVGETNYVRILLSYPGNNIKIVGEKEIISIEKLSEHTTNVDFNDLYAWIIEDLRVGIIYNVLGGNLDYLFEYQCRAIYKMYCVSKEIEYNLQSFYKEFIRVLYNIKRLRKDIYDNNNNYEKHTKLLESATNDGPKQIILISEKPEYIKNYKEAYDTLPETQQKYAAELKFYSDIRTILTNYFEYYLNSISKINEFEIRNMHSKTITDVFLNILLSKSPLLIIKTEGLTKDIELPKIKAKSGSKSKSKSKYKSKSKK